MTTILLYLEGSDGDEQDVKKVLGNVVDDIFKNSSDHGGKRGKGSLISHHLNPDYLLLIRG